MAKEKLLPYCRTGVDLTVPDLSAFCNRLADGLKLFFKEEIIPNLSSKFLFILGPSLAMLTAIMTSAVVPWGDTVHFFDRDISLQIADVNVGILYVFAVVSMGVYGIMIGSWASNNKFSLMGGLRAASQIISYELAMGISLIALLMVTGTLSLKEMVLDQQTGYWNIVYQPLGFLIFLICAFAECNRTPFDLSEAENELIGGYHTEYSSMKLGFYLVFGIHQYVCQQCYHGHFIFWRL